MTLKMVSQPWTSAGPRACSPDEESGRQEGGAYLTVATSPFGRPWQEFTFCPPLLLPADLKVSAQGQTAITQADGIVHLVDWVGENSYPYIPDYLLEGARLGWSNRINPKSSWLRQLTPRRSQIIYVHAHAHDANGRDLRERVAHIKDRPWTCRKHADHNQLWTYEDDGTNPLLAPALDHVCQGIWWQGLNPRAQRVELLDKATGRCQRNMPGDWSWEGYTFPEGYTPDWVPTAFMRAPIGGIEVVAASDGSHAKTLEGLDAAHCGLPVCLTEW